MIYLYRTARHVCFALALSTLLWAPAVLAQAPTQRAAAQKLDKPTTNVASVPQDPTRPANTTTPLGYTDNNSVNTVTLYTDLGTTGRGIAVGANTNDATSAPQDIGFPFVFRGVTFTKFTFNTNGFIKLGSAPPSRDDLYFNTIQTYNGGVINSTSPADSNIIAVMNHDLGPATTGAQPQFRIATTGTAPLRVTTIQWKNMVDMQSPVWAKMEFQIKLYESLNWIEMVYGDFVQLPFATDNWKGYGVGLRGSSNQPDQLLYASHYSVSEWNATGFTNITTFQSSNGNQHNIRPTFPPDMGRTYRFTLPVDKNVRARQLLGLPTFRSCENDTAAQIGMIVTNSGTADQTNIPATIEIAGVRHSFTVPRLNSGQTDTVFYGPVDFSPIGRYTIRGWTALPGDQIPANDSVLGDTVVTLAPIVPPLSDPDTINFDSPVDPSGWVILVTRAPTTTSRWSHVSSDSSSARKGSGYYFISRTPANGRPDEWIVSSCLGLDSGKVYAANFSFRVDVAATNQFLTAYLLRGVEADTSQPIWRTRLNVPTRRYFDTAARFEAIESGKFNIGWRLSGAPQNSTTIIDEISFKLDTGLFIGNTPIVELKKLTLAPNPARDRITLKGPVPTGDCYALAADGRRLRLEVLATEPKERTFRTLGLRPGVYTLLSSDGRHLGRFAVSGD